MRQQTGDDDVLIKKVCPRLPGRRRDTSGEEGS
jgi:hypothetical protein